MAFELPTAGSLRAPPLLVQPGLRRDHDLGAGRVAALSPCLGRPRETPPAGEGREALIIVINSNSNSNSIRSTAPVGGRGEGSKSAPDPARGTAPSPVALDARSKAQCLEPRSARRGVLGTC